MELKATSEACASSLNKDRWISITLSFEEPSPDTESLIDRFLKEAKEKQYYSKYFFQKKEEEKRSEIVLFFYSTIYILKKHLAQFTQLFFFSALEKNKILITCNDFAWVSSSGAHGLMTRELLPAIGKLIFDFKPSREEDQRIVESIYFSLTMLYQLGETNETIPLFFNCYFEEIFKTIEIPEDYNNFEEELLQQFEQNFQNQTEVFDYIQIIKNHLKNDESFDLEWVNQWNLKCSEVATLIKKEPIKYRHIHNHNFKSFKGYDQIPIDQQKKWTIYMNIIGKINNMLDVSFLFLLNTLYLLSKNNK